MPNYKMRYMPTYVDNRRDTTGKSVLPSTIPYGAAYNVVSPVDAAGILASQLDVPTDSNTRLITGTAPTGVSFARGLDALRGLSLLKAGLKRTAKGLVKKGTISTAKKTKDNMKYKFNLY